MGIWCTDACPESDFPTWICSLGAGLQWMFSSMPFTLVGFFPLTCITHLTFIYL